MGKSRGIAGTSVAVAIALLGLFTVWGAFFQVDEGERGVVLRNGAFAYVAEPGFRLKTPFIDSVHDISVRTHKAEFKEMEAYSRDQQPANMRVSVNYVVPAGLVADVYRQFGSIENLEARIISPKVYEQTKNVFGQFDAVTAVQDRTKLNARIAASVHEAIKGLNAPLEVQAVQIEDIQFSKSYMGSIEQRMQASVEVDRYKSNLDREKIQADIAIEQARGRAGSALQEAEAEAKSIKLRGDAQAGAIRARAEALGTNPNLVALTTAEKWDGTLPTTMVPGGGVPMLQLPATRQGGQ